MATTYPIHITIQSPSPVELTPELEALVDGVFKEWREKEEDRRLRESIEQNSRIGSMLDAMRSHYIPGSL